jgi:Patatin-like phospholipase
VLDISVTKISLQSAGIVALIRQGEAAGWRSTCGMSLAADLAISASVVTSSFGGCPREGRKLFCRHPPFTVTTVIAILLQQDRRQTSVFNMASYPTNSQKDTRTQFEQIALLLQGGGALGSYQAGVYQAMAEADLHPNWVAGISIGAINAAIIAGNAPDKRVGRLREFWEAVSTSPLGIPYVKSVELQNAFVHQLVNQGRAANILMFGAPNFFNPRVPPATLWPAVTSDKAS